MAMNMEVAETIVRDLIDEQVGLQNVEGVTFSSNSIQRAIIYIAEPHAYYKQIEIDRSYFIKGVTFSGDGTTELFDLPTDFMKIRNLKPTATNVSNYTEFDLDKRAVWQNYCNSGYGYYYRGSQIGILSVLASGGSAVMLYHNKYTPMGLKASEVSDLHDLAQYLVCLYAAEVVMSSSADVNVQMIQNLRIRFEESEMPNIKRESTGYEALNISQERNPVDLQWRVS